MLGTTEIILLTILLSPVLGVFVLYCLWLSKKD